MKKKEEYLIYIQNILVYDALPLVIPKKTTVTRSLAHVLDNICKSNMAVYTPRLCLAVNRVFRHHKSGQKLRE